MTTISAWAYLIFAVISNAGANFLIKKASLASSENQISIYLNPFFIAGITLFGINLISYTQALRNLPLSTAYPILVGCSLFVISGISIFFLGEAIGIKQALGMLLITLGVWLIT